MIVGSLLCFKNPITQVAYAPPSAFTLIIDKNGYIGSKQPAAGNTYYAYLDKQADFSESGLGQVNIIVPEIGSVEIGGRTYKTTKIGNQTWLAENLDYKFNVNGSQIPINGYNTPTTPAAWYYDRNEATYGWEGKKYGLMYNRYAAKYLDDNKATLLPSGWHVPSKSEWDALINFVGGLSNAGIILKSDTNDWNNPSGKIGHGINSYGFNILPSGYYDSNTFGNLSTVGGFVVPNVTIDVFALHSSISMMWSSSTSSTLAEAIRLVKDVT